MWPLYVSQLADAIAPAARPATGKLDAEIARRAIFRAIGWTGPKLGPRDVFFAVEWKHHDLVSAALANGAVCVVSHRWGGLLDLAPEHRGLCFVADSTLLAYRRLAAAFRRRFTFPVVAVGGSNGKTTTKDMIAAVLAAGGRRVTATPGTNNGWVGTPITLCQPDHTDPAPDALVLEIGIDEKGAMHDHVVLTEPDVAVLTALGPEHLAGLGSHEDAIREELELFAGSKRRVWLTEEPALASRLDTARAGDLIVHDASCSNPLASRSEIPAVAYSWRPLSPTDGSLAVTWQGRTCETRVPMPGAHNGRNAALAIATALLLGRSLVEASSALAMFRGPDQRCVVRELPSGCFLVDDSYNASPSSIEAAIDVLAGFDHHLDRFVILGDMLDLGEGARRWHEAIAPKLASMRGAHVRLYGEHMPALAPLLREAASVGRAGPSEDPSTLIDIHALERSVVLVKGSRGMALERAVATIEALGSKTWDEHALGIGITGSAAEDLARAVRASLSALDAHLKRPEVFVRALNTTELEHGEAQRRRYDIAVIAGFASGERVDVERDLAATAQLVVHLRAGGVAVLATTEEEDEEAMDLLAGVVPQHASVRRIVVTRESTQTLLSNVLSIVMERLRVLASK